EIAAGDLEYYRLSYVNSTYFPVGRESAFLLRGDLGHAGGLGNKPLPFFKSYFAGGPDTVRGFRPFSLGPRDELGNTIGGATRVILGAEFLFPVPGADKENSLRLSTFLDTGQVFGAGQQIQFVDLRAAAGVGLNWLSPFGPLRISYAFPVRTQDGDQ